MVHGRLEDPTLTFQLHEGFHVLAVVSGVLGLAIEKTTPHLNSQVRPSHNLHINPPKLALLRFAFGLPGEQGSDELQYLEF